MSDLMCPYCGCGLCYSEYAFHIGQECPAITEMVEMTTVPPRPPIPKGRGKRHNPRSYSVWEWTRAYAMLVLELPIYVILWALATFVRRAPKWVVRKLLQNHKNTTVFHEMDFRIPPDKTIPVYMERWWKIPRNWAMNIYYHIVRRSDDDRALHDHPWWNFSIVLEGGYYEHEIMEGGIHRKTWYGPGSMRFRWAGKKAHRLELETKQMNVERISAEKKVKPLDLEDWERDQELSARTIFITGPVLRRWGFHHESGWVDAYDWDAFCEANGIDSMKMDGGSDAVVSARNHHQFNPELYRKD